MKEFVIALKEFSKGLRSDANTPRNSQFLTDAYNTRCGVAGLEVPPSIDLLGSLLAVGDHIITEGGDSLVTEAGDTLITETGMIVIEWPLPQIFKFSVGVFAVTSNGLYEAIKVGGSYVWSAVLTGLATGIGYWTAADFGFFILMTNGSVLLKRDGETGEWLKMDVGDLEYTIPSTICNFRGQAVAGLRDPYIDRHSVIWSEIGSVNLDKFLRTPFIDYPTGKQPYKMTSGRYQLERGCEIVNIKPLGKAVVVYGTTGIYVLPTALQPIPTFGLVKLHRFGIKSTSCVAGDDNQHVYVSSDGWLWSLGLDLKPSCLGYKEFIRPLLVGTVVVSHNPEKNDYYISNGAMTYLLSPFGLTRVFQHPTSMFWDDGFQKLIGIGSNATDLSAYITSDILDMQVRGIKTVTALELGSGGQLLTAGIDYRYSMADAFVSGVYKNVNKYGSISPIVSGVEFRVKVKGADYTKFDLDYINIRFKYVDKRMIRGPYDKRFL